MAGALLAVLALFRLGHLVTNFRSQAPVPHRPTEVLVDKEITLRVAGVTGETVRIYFPEVPVGVDTPFGDGRITTKVKLKLRQAPQKMICQVLKGGVVVAQSKPLPLADEAKLDLGVVKVQRSR